jgi:hypothetical protein
MKDKSGARIAIGERVSITGVCRGISGRGCILVDPDGAAGERDTIAVRPELVRRVSLPPSPIYSDPDLMPAADPMLPRGE